MNFTPEDPWMAVEPIKRVCLDAMTLRSAENVSRALLLQLLAHLGGLCHCTMPKSFDLLDSFVLYLIEMRPLFLHGPRRASKCWPASWTPEREQLFGTSNASQTVAAPPGQDLHFPRRYSLSPFTGGR
mmetsp:Transcript_11578/g.35843  ORF Transcript_11578/g.35843 Transcript_11578/m.35843 type:complete len:128 (-) Transcript_11578:308-691(-)